MFMVIISVCNFNHQKANQRVSLKLRDKSLIHWYQDNHNDTCRRQLLGALNSGENLQRDTLPRP